MVSPDFMHSINPATEEVLGSYRILSEQQTEEALDRAQKAFRTWSSEKFPARASLMKKAANYLRQHKARFAHLMTAEMGKPVVESEAEVEKCAWNCDYYADNAERFLCDEPRISNAAESYIQYAPLGVVLAVMPWNYPFWQVFRFAAPALMAGNTAILKHASNVPQCALAIEEVFREAGFPEGAFHISSGSWLRGPQIDRAFGRRRSDAYRQRRRRQPGDLGCRAGHKKNGNGTWRFRRVHSA